MDKEELQARLEWSPVFNREWNNTPDEYAARGIVGWGRSRRLARLQLPAAAHDPGFKAYLGVQHVDPARLGWQSYDEPETRFFVSWFAGSRCLGLRVFPDLAAAEHELWEAYLRHVALVERIATSRCR